MAVSWLLVFAFLCTKGVSVGIQSACPEDFNLVGVWDLRSASSPSRLVIRESGEGYIRDQVEAMAFTYKLDLSRDPLW